MSSSLYVHLVWALVLLACVRMVTHAIEAVARKSVEVAHITGDKAVAASEAAGLRAAEALAYVLKEPAQHVAHAANSLAGAAERFRRVHPRQRARDALMTRLAASARRTGARVRSHHTRPSLLTAPARARAHLRTHACASGCAPPAVVVDSYSGILGQAGAQ